MIPILLIEILFFCVCAFLCVVVVETREREMREREVFSLFFFYEEKIRH